MKTVLFENQFENHVRLRKWFYRISIWFVVLIFLTAFIRNSDWTTTFSRFSLIPIPVVCLLIVIWAFSFYFRAIRFQAEWKAFGNVSLFAALRLTILHNASVILIPFRVGEVGYPILVKKLMNVTWQQCVRSLMWIRLQDALVLISLAFIFFPIFNFQYRLFSLITLAILAFALRGWWLRKLRSRHILVKTIRSFLHQRADAWGWVWSTGNWLCKLTVVSILLHLLTGTDTLNAINGGLAGELSALLPISGPAGLGTYEAGVCFGLDLPWTLMRQLLPSILFIHIFVVSVSLGCALIILLVDVCKYSQIKFNYFK